MIPKIGDKVYGFCQTRDQLVFVEIRNVHEHTQKCYGLGFKQDEYFCGPISFDSIITEEIYNSPLWKVLEEK